jgi:hypothetical protein
MTLRLGQRKRAVHLLSAETGNFSTYIEPKNLFARASVTQPQKMAGLTLNQVLIIFGGITAVVYLGIQAALHHSDRQVPERWDRAYVVFGSALMTAVLINSVSQLVW